MKYFLQFYREETYLYGNAPMMNFNNGLSYVWDKLKDLGVLVWKHVDDESPITSKGEIWASVWYSKSFRLLCDWAKTYTDLQVYICGPLVLHYEFKTGRDIPNLHFVRESAEDVFFKGETSKWNLEIPETDMPIGYSVGLTNGYGCYWGRCRYCKITGKLTYRNIDHIPVIDHKHHKYIWIHTYSMPPHWMKKLYPTFENRKDVSYATYIRGDMDSAKALNSIIPRLKIDPSQLGFDVGIEFPSNKILDYMDKGTTVEEYLAFIKVAAGNNIQLHFNIILGWKNTDVDDIKSVEYFLNVLSKISKPNTITVNLYPLTIVSNRKMFADYTMDEIEPFETDYDILIGMPKQNEKQMSLNRELRGMFNSYPFLKVHDLAGSDSTWCKNSYGKR